MIGWLGVGLTLAIVLGAYVLAGWLMFLAVRAGWRQVARWRARRSQAARSHAAGGADTRWPWRRS